MSATCPRIGLLLVGHGTRSRQGAEEFLALAALVGRELAGVSVEPAFLELTEPTIQQGLSRLVERGVRQVVVVPLLLFAAGHAKRDIPAAVEAAARECGSTVPVEHGSPTSSGHWPLMSGRDGPTTLALHYAAHLGCAGSIVQLSQQRFTQSLQDRPEVPADRTCLLLVGRGSHDGSATAQMHHFARLQVESMPIGGAEVAFMAMARPAVQDVLPRLAARNWQRIVVQPHLLFHGELYDQLQQRVQAMADQHPRQEWIVTPYLADGLAAGGPAAELLVAAVLQRFQAAGIRVVAPGGDG